MQNKKKQAQTSLMSFTNKGKKQKSKQIDSNLSKSVDNNSDNSSQTIKIDKPLLHINVQFYRNIRVSQPSGDYIQKIHQKWWGNYDILQKHHGYIQWLFPNSFSSRFNSKSSALTPDEQKIFRTDIEIAKRYVKSYQMILQFFGMKLKSKITGEITQQRRVNFKQRYYATLLTSFHNHMRVTRILCSLLMIGFGRYAKQLSLFLNQEIHSQKGNLKSLGKHNVDKDWKVYHDYIQTEQDLNVYLREMQKKAHISSSDKSQQKIALQFLKNEQKNQLNNKKEQQKK